MRIMRLLDIRIVPAIKKISMENTGILGDREFEFVDGINLVVASLGCGKTTLIRSISGFFGDVPGPPGNGSVCIELRGSALSAGYEEYRRFREQWALPLWNEAGGDRYLLYCTAAVDYFNSLKGSWALLIDDYACILDKPKIKKLNDIINNLEKQVILTCLNKDWVRGLNTGKVIYLYEKPGCCRSAR